MFSRALADLCTLATKGTGGDRPVAGRRPRSEAAGPMAEAIEQADEELEFTDWEGADDKFALRVNGNSMIDEHITDGDFVVIRRQETARDGQIVAVRDDEGEATLKRLFREKNRVR